MPKNSGTSILLDILIYCNTYIYSIIYIRSHRWTDIELKRVIAMHHNLEFDAKDLDPSNLHQSMQKAVEDGSIKCFIPLHTFLYFVKSVVYLFELVCASI